MTKKPDDSPIDIWFRLKERMIREYAGDGVSLRPPSLRDACYAYVLAMRTDTRSDPETIEAYINGLELGAMEALRTLWKNRND